MYVNIYIYMCRKMNYYYIKGNDCKKVLINMGKIKNTLNNIKIRTKLLIVYFMIVTITVLTVGIYFTAKMSKKMLENSKNDARYVENQIKQRLEETLRLATSTSDMIYQDERLHKIITKQYTNYAENVRDYIDYPILSNYLRYYGQLANIRLYVENQNILDNSNIVKVTDNVKNSSWYKVARENKGVITWDYAYDYITKDYSLALIRDITSDIYGHIGVLVISIQTSKLVTLINEQPYPVTILIDETVVVSSEYEKGSKLYIGNNDGEVNYFNDKREEFNLNNKYIISERYKVDKSFKNIFQVFVSIPIYEITETSKETLAKSISIISIAITISLIIILYFSNLISDRFKFLRDEMEKVVNGDFDIKESMEGRDEISDSYNDFYKMVISIKKLINEVYVQELEQKKLIVEQKDAQFKMLASQINPHFLYNTLETIRMRAFCNGDKELATIVKKLGKIMRRNLEVTNNVVSLKSEIEMIEGYLDIQSLRFQGKVKYNFNVEIKVEEYEILPLLLQPIVENAFKHGLEASTSMGEITISIYDEVGYLIIEVSDNGVGIEKEKLDFINEKLKNYKNSTSKSIGISNVNERIKMFYGEEYGLYIMSNEGVGTKVIILLPTKRDYKMV